MFSVVSSALSGAAANCWDDILKNKLSEMKEFRKALLNRIIGEFYSTRQQAFSMSTLSSYYYGIFVCNAPKLLTHNATFSYEISFFSRSVQVQSQYPKTAETCFCPIYLLEGIDARRCQKYLLLLHPEGHSTLCYLNFMFLTTVSSCMRF